MSKVRIMGASDDLIELDGDIYEEFNDDDGLLAFSDGTVLHIQYDQNGFWRINRLEVGSAEYTKTEASNADEDYSDVVVLRGDIKWVVFGKEIGRAT